MNYLPLYMQQYFENVINVAGDGHCRFRVVSGLIGDSVDSYNMVYLDLSIELKQNKKRYFEVFASEERFDQIRYALIPGPAGDAPKSKWFMFPDMGFLVAQKYNTGFVLLTRSEYSETFFSLEGEPPNREKLLCIGWVNNNHFMQIHLKPDSPIPQTSRMWDKHHLKSADRWPDRYVQQLKLNNNLKRSHGGIVVEDEMISPRAKVVIGVDDTNDEIEVSPVGLSKD
jgi:histone-lysine N-methyltransferase SETD2